MNRMIGLDFGSRTVGVAVSDPLHITAQPVETIWRKQESHLRKTLQRIEELVKEYEADTIVLGCPMNMNGTAGERVTKTREFRDALERRLPGMKVLLRDERLTTAQAEKVLMEGGVRREDRKEHLDSMAAVLILQNYLDFQAINKDNI